MHLKLTSFNFPDSGLSFAVTVLIFVFDGVTVKTSTRNVFTQLGCTMARSVRTDLKTLSFSLNNLLDEGDVDSGFNKLMSSRGP